MPKKTLGVYVTQSKTEREKKKKKKKKKEEEKKGERKERDTGKKSTRKRPEPTQAPAHVKELKLTSVTVLSLPPVQTDFGAVLAAIVVPELIVPRPTQVIARGAVVVVVADEAVGVDEFGVTGGVLGVVPIRARRRRTLNRQTRDQFSGAS